MATSDTLINTLFDGRYRILRRLGRGGMADVYLAEDEELGRRVAIKILNERHAADEQFVERFRREATNAAGLSHPNIVSIYDRGEAEGTYYIAMEYLEGSTLKDIVGQRGPLPVGEAIGFTRDILGALKVAHRKGIVHRDIKPHNVMCDADGRVKVTDFGIARAGASQMTEAGSIIGTAQYLSPEQARGGVVDARSDLYSVGVVLYELLTGTVPFNGDTTVEIAMKHLSTTPEPPSARRPELPQALDQIVLRALAKDPDERYQTAEEMDAELARVAEGYPVSPETAEAATQVLAGAGAIDTAATAIARAPTAITPRPPAEPPAVVPPYRPPSRGYYYEEPPPRRRAVWPWIVVGLLVLAAAAAVFLAWGKIQDQLNKNTAVAVPYVGRDQRDQRSAQAARGGIDRHVRHGRQQLHQARPERDGARSGRDLAGSAGRRQGAEGQARQPAGLERRAGGCRAGCAREDAHRRDRDARRPGAPGVRDGRALVQAAADDRGPGPGAGHEGADQDDGAHQRLEGAGAGGHAERRRADLRRGRRSSSRARASPSRVPTRRRTRWPAS